MRCGLFLWAKSLAVIILMIGFLAAVFPIRASIDSCSGSVSPTELTRNTQTTLTFTITNSSSEDATYIGISSPNSYFAIVDAISSGFSVDYQDAFEVILSGGTIPAGQSGTVSVSVSTADIEWASESWEVKLDSQTSGDSYTVCSGSPSTSIVTGSTGDNTAPVISGITISNVKDSSVTVSWVTNEESDSEIRYGADLSFGSVVQNSSLVTSHSLNISNLSANTTYNFKLYSSDLTGNQGESSANKFTTASQGSTGSTVTITTTRTVTPTPTPTPIPDRVKPVVKLETEFLKPFETPPSIKGSARDAKGIVKVEYSIDGGKNWSNVDTMTKPSSSVAFAFTPPALDDDNYSVIVRAIDSSGNIGTSDEVVMVIDRLPPQVGASLFSLGAQILSSRNGVVYGLEGVKQKVTLSSVGGPISIDILAGRKTIDAVKNVDNGLWSADLIFDKPGSYLLEADSIDGADNRTHRELSSIAILPAGKITDGSVPLSKSTVSIFVKDPQTKGFILWDGKAYGQRNPQVTGSDGKYKLLVPPGTYYVEIRSPLYRTLKTQIFTANTSSPINQDFTLQKTTYFELGPIRIPLLSFSIDTVEVNLEKFKAEEAQHEIIGKRLPGVKLSSGENIVSTDEFSGRPTLITFLATWDPSTFAQIGILENLKSDNSKQVLAIFEQENAFRLAIFQKRGGYSTQMLADVDGELVEPLVIHTLPMHILLDRRGVVEDVKYGVLNEKDLIDFLLN